MPSAGRPLTTRLITDLTAHGVAVLPVVLHSGVASYESGEIPAEERYQVPEPTAQAINALRAGGGRLVAVGTTVVRALESAADRLGRVHPTRGVTDLVITPERGVTVVDGLITGWHDNRSTHRLLLEALTDGDLVDLAYAEASSHGYLTHEFGDSLIVL
jgi:S-adenosylmethionine:tRNA ribosyltransferase-isomerase